MNAAEQYRRDGAILLRGLFPREIVSALAYQISLQVQASGTDSLTRSSLGNRSCYEASSGRWPMLITLLWGLTPRIQELAEAELLPTYAYFRTYQQGDVCRIHADRPACEHSISLTLAYSDGIEWPLAVANAPRDFPTAPSLRGDDDFGASPYTSFPMAPGDAVLYRGTDYRHGRPTTNPNRWSAHLFMHWVDKAGPSRDAAFDGMRFEGPTDFRFPDDARAAPPSMASIAGR